MALIAQAATLEARVPFIHFFDGFRTSHEVNKIDLLADAEIRAMIDAQWCGAPWPGFEPGPSVHSRHCAKSGRVFPGQGNR